MRNILSVILLALPAMACADVTIDRRQMNGQELWEMSSEMFDGQRMLPVQVVYPVKPQVEDGLELEQTYRIRTGMSVEPGPDCPDAVMCYAAGRRLVTREEWFEISRYAVRNRKGYINAKSRDGALVGLGMGGGFGLGLGLALASLVGGLTGWLLIPLILSAVGVGFGSAIGNAVAAKKARSQVQGDSLFDVRTKVETHQSDYVSPTEQVDALNLIRAVTSGSVAAPQPAQNPVQEPGDDRPRLLPIPGITDP